MSSVIDNTAHIYRLVQLCYVSGVRHAVVCPGSRCAPLLLGFGKHSSIETISVTDERSAGYVALGLSQQSGAPVALVCTSGTAGLNFAPVVAEAFYQNVPLVVLTADRPAELIDQWDGQTIHQADIYKNHIQGYLNYTKESQFKAKELFGCMGPVHFNIPIEEPFYPENIAEVEFDNIQIDGVAEKPIIIDDYIWDELRVLLAGNGGVLLLAGQMKPSPVLCGLLQKAGVLVVADIASNLQCMTNCQRTADIDCVPGFLITIGRSIVSKQVRHFLRDNKPKVHWHIGRGMVGDPFQSITKVISVDPELFFSELVRRDICFPRLESRSECSCFEGVEFSSVGVVERILYSMPENSVLHLGNSMPIRIADLLGVISRKLEVWSNRGTSGIDGVVSTAVGHALANCKKLHTLIVGDLSFFYDRNGLWLNHEYPDNLRIIILNDGGGGIFNMISGPAEQGELTRLFTVPHTRTAKLTAEEFGLQYAAVFSYSDLDMTLERYDLGIIEIFTNMQTDANVFKRIINR